MGGHKQVVDEVDGRGDDRPFCDEPHVRACARPGLNRTAEGLGSAATRLSLDHYLHQFAVLHWHAIPECGFVLPVTG